MLTRILLVFLIISLVTQEHEGALFFYHRLRDDGSATAMVRKLNSQLYQLIT